MFRLKGHGKMRIGSTKLVCRFVARRRLLSLVVESVMMCRVIAPPMSFVLSKSAVCSDSFLLVKFLLPPGHRYWCMLMKEAIILRQPLKTRRFVLTYVADAEWPEKRSIGFWQYVLRQHLRLRIQFTDASNSVRA
jgi:hypothetical protein